MAGRKRKTYQEQTRQPEKQVQEAVLEWPTAIYARLSLENGGKDDNGESIENQVEICRSYLSDHPYLHLYSTYMDNGWTGTNTKRPEFQRMLSDIHAGKVKAIVLKDFSRFSRDYIEAGNLLENVFPFLGVRFISVVDRYDSFETDGTAESLLIPLKNLINSYYSKDISRKVSTAVHSRQLIGEYLPGTLPYGYQKSETEAYRLVPDPETADVVRRIFSEYHAGVTASQIARKLNEEEIPSPGQIRFRRGQTSRPCYETSRWSAQGIKKMLRNPTYAGDLVFGRMPKALYLGNTQHLYEPDETKWRVLPNMHEPLVDRKTFQEVALILAEKRKQYNSAVEKNKQFREENPAALPGYVYCGDCGGKMIFIRHKDSRTGRIYCTYHCARYISKRCTALHSITQDKLVSVVWNAMKDQLVCFADYKEMVGRMQSRHQKTTQQVSYKNEMKSIVLKAGKCMEKRERLYEDFTCGILSAEDYISLKQSYDEEYQRLNRNLNHLQTLQSRLDCALSDQNGWLVHMQLVQDAEGLTSELAEALIDKIYVYQTGRERRVEIVFKYRDEFSALQAAYEELERSAEK